MLPDIADVQAEIRSHVSLNFKTPILDHAWASIVRCDEQYTTKGAAALTVGLCRIEVWRSGKARHSVVKQEGRIEKIHLVCKAWLGTKPERACLTEIGVVQ